MSIPTGNKVLPLLALTCSKSIIETVEKVWNMFKFNNKNTRTMSLFEGIITGKNGKKYIIMGKKYNGKRYI